MPPRSPRPDRPSRCSMRAGAHFEPCCSISARTQACGLRKSMKRFPPRPAACVTAAPARKAGKILEPGDGSALCAKRSMIVTSMQLIKSSRRDIAVLQKESPSLRAERMSRLVLLVRRVEQGGAFFARSGNAFLEILRVTHRGHGPEARIHGTDEIQVPALP